MFIGSYVFVLTILSSSRLIGLEQDLMDFAEKQGVTAEEIINMVNENENLLDGMKANLRKTFVAAMVCVIGMAHIID